MAGVWLYGRGCGFMERCGFMAGVWFYDGGVSLCQGVCLYGRGCVFMAGVWL